MFSGHSNSFFWESVIKSSPNSCHWVVFLLYMYWIQVLAKISPLSDLPFHIPDRNILMMKVPNYNVFQCSMFSIHIYLHNPYGIYIYGIWQLLRFYIFKCSTLHFGITIAITVCICMKDKYTNLTEYTFTINKKFWNL